MSSYQTLVEAIYERYNDTSDEYHIQMMASSPDSSSDCSKSFDDNSIVSFYIPTTGPHKTQSGVVVTTCSLIMSDQNISTIGDSDALKRTCKNVIEMDLAKNQIDSWDEVKKLLNTLKQLRLLNLSQNPLPTKFFNPTQSDYFDDLNSIHSLRILILNKCYIDLDQLQYLLEKLSNLDELHLCSNNYKHIDFDKNFRMHSLTILYLNNNQLYDWDEVCKLGIAFPNLDTLVISDNNIADFSNKQKSFDENIVLTTSESFKNLQQLIANKIFINDWSTVDQLRDFPRLKHVRLHNIPLLETYTDEEKYFFLVAHLEGPTSLNGSEISHIEKENCERKYIRYHMDRVHKPTRYFELERKHGKLNKLAEINLEATKKVFVKIKFNDKQICEYVDVRMTVGEFKKHLEKFVDYASNRFRVFYIDIGLIAMGSPCGAEELRHSNRCLHSFNIHDGDEFEIDLKPQLEQFASSVRLNQLATKRIANKAASDCNILDKTNRRPQPTESSARPLWTLKKPNRLKASSNSESSM